MDQQHCAGQARRRRHILLEVEQHITWLGRIVILDFVTEDKLILEIHQAVRAIGLWRGLGYQSGHAAAAIASDVVPDDLDTALGNRKRYGGIEVFQAVAAAYQIGTGSVFLDRGKHRVRHGSATVSRVHRELVAVRVTFEHRDLAWGQFVLVLVDVLRGDGVQRLLARIRVGQEAFGVNRTSIGRQRLPGAD
ncbi:hypothetical protein D3C78_759940 [compost metagenome]